MTASSSCNASSTTSISIGHAKRVGLAGDRTQREIIDRLLPTLRSDVVLESDRIRDEEFPHVYRMREWSPPEDNAAELARFSTSPWNAPTRSPEPIISSSIEEPCHGLCL
jgi:hypothetical protein